MKGIVIHCPYKHCKKPLFKNANVRIGSYFSFICYYCGMTINLKAEPGRIMMEVSKVQEEDLTDDDEGDTIFLST